MTAIDWGWSIEDTAKMLMQESAKARENGGNYAVMTAQNAAAPRRALIRPPRGVLGRGPRRMPVDTKRRNPYI